VQLPYAGSVRIDFTLELGGLSQTVEVTFARDSILRESSASVGDVLTQDRVQNLPLVGNNVMDLLNTLPGIIDQSRRRVSEHGCRLSINTINSTRDGLPIADGRQAADDPTTAREQGVSPTTTWFPIWSAKSA
jgi:hypothetical protein